jgi:hypothetical protein
MLINRIGTFFILLGIGLIGLFVLSDMAKSPTCGFLIFGFFSLGLGIFMWIRDPFPPAQPSGRFRILKGGRRNQEKKK